MSSISTYGILAAIGSVSHNLPFGNYRPEWAVLVATKRAYCSQKRQLWPKDSFGQTLCLHPPSLRYIMGNHWCRTKMPFHLFTNPIINTFLDRTKKVIWKNKV